MADLREAPPAEFFDRLHQAMGEDGLLTYRYLGRITADMHGTAYDSMRLRSDMRNASGGIGAAALAIATAEAGGFTDFNAVPAPLCSGLTIIDDARDVTEIRIHRETVHQGRTTGFVRGVVTDAADPNRVIALTRGVGVKLGEAPPGEYTFFPIPQEIVDSPSLPPLHEVFGGYKTADGHWALPEMTASSQSTSGGLHLGPIHIILEAAATEMAAKAANTDSVQIEDWDVMFAARGLIGPFVVSGDATLGKMGRVSCQLQLRDQGKANRVVATVSAIFRAA